jgi:hypothetical protein
MNRITKTALRCLVLCVLLLSPAWGECVFASPPTRGGDPTPINNLQNEITITCPDKVTYQAQSIAEWNAGMHSIKQMKFVDATVSGRTLNCNYSGLGGGDWSVLMREMPAGYICTTDRAYGTKNRIFLCKRAVAPIKIRPKL